MAAFLSLSAFSAAAVENNNATLTFDPTEGSTLKEFPEVIVLTVDGPESIKKDVVAGNPLLVTDPEGNKCQMTATYNGNTLTLKAPSTLVRDIAGVYNVQLKKNAINYIWADGSKTKCVQYDFTYTVEGNGGGGPDNPGDDNVKFDITLTATTPSLKPFEADMKTFETLQMFFNAPNLNVTDDATVTVKGPNYNYTVPLTYNMGSIDGKQTNIKALFPTDPVYNGEYKLIIPQGVIGNEAYLADHSKGRANEAIDMTFTVTGGLDPSGITTDITFNPIVMPGLGSKLARLDEATLTFDSKVYYSEDAALEVGVKYDQQATAFSSYGKALITRISDTELKLTFDPALPTETMAEYAVTVPEGAFWNEEHEADNTKGAINSAQRFNWFITGEEESFEILGTDPKTNTLLPSLPVGFTFTVNTNNNAKVERMDVTVTYYSLLSATETFETLLTASTSSKNEEGAIYWENQKEEYVLESGCMYDIEYTLYDKDGENLYDGTVSLIGNHGTGIEAIASDSKDVKVYDLLGRKVSGEKLPAGIYVINGKKVIVK